MSISVFDNMPIEKFFLGFIRVHILYHASKQPIYGQWMIDELKTHGYTISPGTMYPILHDLENNKLLTGEKVNHNGKIRKYYSITGNGKTVLADARKKITELVSEVMD